MIAWIVAAVCFGAMLRVIWVGARNDIARWRVDTVLASRLRAVANGMLTGVMIAEDADTLREAAEILEARASDGD